MNIGEYAKEGWIALQQPIWLLLLIPLLLGCWFRFRAYHLAQAHYAQAKKEKRRWQTRVRFSLPPFCMFVCMAALVGALADITRRFVFAEEEVSTQRFFVNVDASSSMYGFHTPLRSITCAKNAELFPRIHSACRAVSQLISGVERFASSKQNEQEKDTIGIGQFATYSYVIAYPTQDYDRLREKVRQMEFKSDVLGIFTNMHLAMWDMYLMALDRNLRHVGTPTHINGKELRLLAASLAPDSALAQYLPPRELKERLLLIKEELRDTVFVFITDALVTQIDRVMNMAPFSLVKQMQLAAFLEIPVFFLSTDEYHAEMKRLARLTGFGPAGGSYRGDFMVVRREHDFVHIEELIRTIMEARFRMTVSRMVERRESYAEWCIVTALIFAGLGILLKKTIARSLTDI